MLLCFFPVFRSSSRSPSYSSKSCKKSPGSRSSRPRRSPSYSRYSRSRYSVYLWHLLSTHWYLLPHTFPCLHHCHAAVSGGQSLRLQLAPAAGLQPLSDRDLVAAGKDTLLLRVTALRKSCQARGRAPAVRADAGYPEAGTHSLAGQRERQSRHLYSLHTIGNSLTVQP